MKRISFDFAAAGAIFLAVILVPLIVTTVLAQSSGEDKGGGDAPRDDCIIFPDGTEYCIPPTPAPTDPPPPPTPACTIHYIPFPPWEIEDCGDEATPVPTPEPEDTPIPDTPIPDTPIPDTPIPDTPVPDTPVPDTPVPDTPVPDTPVPDTPVPAWEPAALNLTGTPGVESITLRWDSDANAHGYVVEQLTDRICRGAGGPGTSGPRFDCAWDFVNETTGSSFTVSGLTPGTPYTHRVRSYKNASPRRLHGPWEQVTRTPEPLKPQIAIVSYQEGVQEGATITFALTAFVPSSPRSVVLPPPQPLPPVNVEVTGTPSFLDGPSTWTITVADPTFTVATVGDDTDELDGIVTARILSGTGYTIGSPSESSVVVRDDDPGPTDQGPETPTDFRGEAGHGSITLTWKTVTNATGYEVQQRQAGETEWSPLTIDINCAADVCTAVVTGLSGGVEHFHQVRSVNSTSGTSDWTEPPVSTTPRAALPTTPIVESTPGNRRVTLRWSVVNNATGYQIQQFSENSIPPEWIPLTVSINCADGVCTATIEGLTNGVTYFHQVRAVNASVPNDYVYSEWTEPPIRTTPRLEAPTDLRGQPGDMSITLQWTAVAGATSYRVQQWDGNLWRFLTVAVSCEAGVCTATIEGLTNGVTYSHRVQSVNGADSSDWTDRFDTTTQVEFGAIGDNSSKTRTFTVTPGVQPSTLRFNLLTNNTAWYDGRHYAGRTYIVEIEGVASGGASLPTRTTEMQLQGSPAPVTLADGTHVATLADNQRLWLEGDDPPNDRDIELTVAPISSSDVVANYRVTISKPDFAFLGFPAIQMTGNTATGHALNVSVMARNNTSERPRLNISFYCSDPRLTTPQKYLEFSFNPTQSRAVNFTSVCRGIGWPTSSTEIPISMELARGELRHHLVQRGFTSSGNLSSDTTLWHRQNDVMGGLQFSAQVDDENRRSPCTLSFILGRLPILAPTPTPSVSTTAHCEDGIEWHQGLQPFAPSETRHLGTTSQTPAPASCVVPGSSRASECRIGDQAYANLPPGTTSNEVSIAKPKMRNTSPWGSQLDHTRDKHFQLSGSRFTIVGAQLPVARTNETVHKVGRTTGWTSGTIWELPNEDERTPGCPGDKRNDGSDNYGGLTDTVHRDCVVYANLVIGGGDSGSPVFIRTNQNPDEVILVGVILLVRNDPAKDGLKAGFVPIDRIYAESLRQGYDWSPEQLRPIPALDDPNRQDEEGLEQRGATIKATFLRADFSPTLFYRAQVFVDGVAQGDRQCDFSLDARERLGRSKKGHNPGESGAGCAVTEVNPGGVEQIIVQIPNPNPQVGRTYTVKLSACMESAANFTANCGAYGGDGGKSVTITTQDPVISATRYEVPVAQSATRGSVVVRVLATDPDANDILTYRFTGGNEGGWFAIGRWTGYVTVAASFGETGGSPRSTETASPTTYELDVEVTDGRSGTATTTVVVTLSNLPEASAPANFSASASSPTGVDLSWEAVTSAVRYRVEYRLDRVEAWTVGDETITGVIHTVDGLTCGTAYEFRVRAYGDGTTYVANWGAAATAVSKSTTACNQVPEFGSETYAFTVAEDATTGTAVGTVTATDADTDDTVTYAITAGNDASLFAIDTGMGAITVAGALDYETATTHTLTVEASDDNEGAATAEVAVEVTNVADTPPAAPDDFTVTWQEEDTQFWYRWSPLDGADRYQIQERIPGVLDEWRDLTTTSGTSVTARKPGAGCVRYEYQIRARGDGVQYTAEWSAYSDAVAAEKGCNRAPEFVSESPAFRVTEDAATGAAVGTVTATDPDTGDTVTYAITAGNDPGKFAIDSSTGAITVVGALNYEAATSYTLTVEATDGNGGTATVDVAISVTNVNEPPAFGSGPYAFTVAEDATTGAAVGTVRATDPDTGDTVTHAITTGNDAGLFAIDSGTGAITVAGALDYETTMSYTLTAEASDGNGGTATVDVAISITNVVETTGVTVTLSPREEQHSTGTDITIEWTDPDACDSQYFVGVYNNEELYRVERILGFHPAPATTTLNADLNLSWDSVPSHDWWVGVNCASSSGWRVVGKASLQSGLRNESDPPSITITDLVTSVENGQSDGFAVSVSNLDAASSYSIRVTTDDADLGFDSDCADRQEDVTVPAGNTSHTAALTLHGCAVPGGTVTVTLLSGGATIATATQDVTVEARPNRAATGAPTIGGTARVEETLTADTSDIADADGLNNATYHYQWLAADAEVAGATGSTYTLTASDEGKIIKVRVSFNDDRGAEEMLTSAATGAVADAPVVTARFDNAPASHDGQNSFTFELRFSEEVSVGFRMLRDDAFSVTGGTLTSASRLEQGSNLRWQIIIQPESDSDVIVALPATTDCTAQGAICTTSGRMLSERVELTVSGPEVTEPLSNDATLRSLTLSGVDVTFDAAVTQYTAAVANAVTETTVTPTANDDGATYVVKLGGVADADGTVPLSVGENVITIDVTAEDGNATRTYTVTVTRAAAAVAPPGTPDRPSGQRTGPGAVSLDWNGVPPATSYDVMFWLVAVNGFVQLSPDNAVHGISITFNGSSATVTGLSTTEHDGWYAFVVRAVNDAGTSGWSGNNRIPVPADTPYRPSGQRTGPGAVSLDWNDVPTATSYVVEFWHDGAYVQLSADAAVHGISITFNGSSAAVTGLPTAGYEWYYFRVRAVNAGGTSGWSPNNAIAVPA